MHFIEIPAAKRLMSSKLHQLRLRTPTLGSPTFMNSRRQSQRKLLLLGRNQACLILESLIKIFEVVKCNRTKLFILLKAMAIGGPKIPKPSL